MVLGLRVCTKQVRQKWRCKSICVHTWGNSRKTFRRVTTEKNTLTREIDILKNCWNFEWLKENLSVPVSWERKPEKHSMPVSNCIDWWRSVYCKRLPVVCVPVQPVTIPTRSVTVPIQSVTVNLARRDLQHCTRYCLLPPALVYFAVIQPGLFSVYCLIRCTTTKTLFSELPQVLCWSAIVFSVTRAVIS